MKPASPGLRPPRSIPAPRFETLAAATAMALAALALNPTTARAQSSAFTYQGRLADAGAPATGTYDLRFTLHAAASGGTPVPGTPAPSGLIQVSNGLFTATLDFGATAFPGSPRWLEIAVRTNGSPLAHTILAPRQPVSATPYASRAAAAGSAETLTGAVSDSQIPATIARLQSAQTFTATPTFSPATAGAAPFAVTSSNKVANLHADLLDGFSAQAFWNVGGNAGSGPTNFLGTLDSQPLQFRVNNAPALRLEPAAASPNLLGGHAGNHAVPGIAGAVIGGGGTPGATNTAAAPFATISGGRAQRVAGTAGTIAGGETNTVLAPHGAIGGGVSNLVLAALSTIAGGGSNTASGLGAAIGGGSQHLASGLRTTIAGGLNHRASGAYSAIAGGANNTAAGLAAAVPGGYFNDASGDYATVPGGFDNAAAGFASFAAGNTAQALHAGSFVWSDSSTGTAFASTAPNQFLVRADGGVGIGAPPTDALLDVEGNLRANDYDLFLRGLADRNHGLGWYGSTKPFAGIAVDGPVLYGWAGGALATTQGGARAVLRWTAAGHVGLGLATLPAARLHVADSVQTVGLFEGSSPDGTWLSLGNTAPGGQRWSLISTGPSNGETAGQLLLFGNGSTRVTVRDTGHVGIGTTSPGERLEVLGPDATLRLKNQNDPIGAFAGNTFGTLQLGLYNPTATAQGVVGAGAKRSVLGLDSNGRVGSMTSSFGFPTFRNLLDDGAGNVSVSTAGGIQFGAATRQMLNLWNAEYGVGIQAFTLYQRTGGNFAWYRGGAHADGAGDPGGGSTLMRLDNAGLTVNGTFISSSDRDRKENFDAVNPREVLRQVARLPIRSWNYKESPEVRHIGPMAQDFHAAFGVGPDDRHIAMVDADGVALAAIQGLQADLAEKEAAIAELRRRNESLESRLAAIESRLNRLAAPTTAPVPTR